MQAEMFDDVPYVCPNCEDEYDDAEEWLAAKRDDGERCEYCWVNDECPDGCNGEHDAPTPDDRGQWECPTSGNVFRCYGYRCDLEWDEDRWDEGSTYIDGEWYTDPSEAGYEYCENCDEWRDYDDMRYDRHGDQRGCSYCARGSYGMEAERGHGRCNVCRRHRVPTHHHPITEQLMCGTCAEENNLDGWERIDALLEVAA